MRNRRQGIVIWFQRRKNLKQIKRYGHLIYASKKQKYALLYVNQSEIDVIEEKLNKLPYVIKTERSYKPFIRTDFEKKVPDKVNQYDYNVGI